MHAILFATQREAVRQTREQGAAKADDVAIFLAIRFAPADPQHAGARCIHDPAGGDHDAVDIPRRRDRDGAIVDHVVAHA